MPPALRALAWFWAGLALMAVGAVVLLRFGGPSSPSSKAAMAAPGKILLSPKRVEAVAAARAPSVVTAATPPPMPASRPTSVAAPGRSAITAPDPTLEEPAPDYVGSILPRVGADGRTPMRTYAAANVFDDHRPRIAVLLTGIGLSATEDEVAVDTLPAAVSFAVSPYAYHPGAILQKMRDRGHESFLSLPMEPQGFPIDDPGPEALLTGNIDGVNQQRLEWAMSRIAGYVGVTSIMGTLRGERFAGSPTQMAAVLRELGSRGLIYIDGRPGASRLPGSIERSVDAVIDAPAAQNDTETKLAQLEAMARERGSAVAAAGPPHPVVVARLASWAATLAARGFDLVPVSAVVSAEPPMTEAATVKP